MTDNKVTSYAVTTEAFHCDFLHQLCIGHLGNSLLTASDIHSTERQFGMTYLNTINKTWVLSRLALEMYSIPKEHEEFVIETWVENAVKYFTKRNWALISKDGQTVYGYAKSIWAMIDTETRQPQDILAVHDGKIMDYLLPEKPCDMADVSRVKVPEMTDYTEFRILYNDIDVNGHCNSMKYIDHVMDTYTLDYLSTHQLHRLEIAYVAEGHYGDTVRIYHAETSTDNHAYRLCRHNGDGEETELCRLKVTFDAKG